MSHYGGDNDTWDSITNAPTAHQLSYIEKLCEHLGYDYRIMVPDDFDEAIDIIDRLEDEAGWDD